MPKIVTLTLSPKQASDAKFYAPLVARELRIKESDIALLRIVKRSVDARRGALKVNLSLEAYIDTEEQPAPLNFDYPSVVGKPEIIIVGAGPSGLSAAIEAAKRGLKVVVFDLYSHFLLPPITFFSRDFVKSHINRILIKLQ